MHLIYLVVLQLDEQEKRPKNYRFGHSQIRPFYTLNSSGVRGQIFPDCKGTCPVTHDRVLD